MEKKRLTADQILKQRVPYLMPDGNYDDSFVAAMQEFASQESSAKDERIKELEEALRAIEPILQIIDDELEALSISKIIEKVLSTKPEEK